MGMLKKKDIYKMTWTKLEKEITRLDKLDKKYWNGVKNDAK